MRLGKIQQERQLPQNMISLWKCIKKEHAENMSLKVIMYCDKDALLVKGNDLSHIKPKTNYNKEIMG